MDGSELDSSYQRGKPSQFHVKRVIKGWREDLLLLMKEGAKWELYIPPELAYGTGSPNKRIPPNSARLFEMDLLSVEAAPPRSREGLVPPRARELDEE